MRKTLDVVIPVWRGKAAQVEPYTDALLPRLEADFADRDWRLVFAANGARQEELLGILARLERKDGRIRHESVPDAGKGNGVLLAWANSRADALAYMDVDLSTDLSALRGLVDGIDGGADLCIGSRYHPDSRVERSFRRRAVSVVYHRLLLRGLLGVRAFTDGQCGFKAIGRRAADALLPKVRNRLWFFHTKLLWLAEKGGWRIREIPVRWKESGLSGLNLVSAIAEFLSGIVGLGFRKP